MGIPRKRIAVNKTKLKEIYKTTIDNLTEKTEIDNLTTNKMAKGGEKSDPQITRLINDMKMIDRERDDALMKLQTELLITRQKIKQMEFFFTKIKILIEKEI